MARKQHAEVKTWPLVRADPSAAADGFIHRCGKDGEPWPCEYAVLRDMYSRVIARIRQRQSLFRLSFDDRRVTRSMLRAQAEEFERWLATLDPAS